MASLASRVCFSQAFCSLAPDGLEGAVGHVVGRAVVAALDKPDLQVAGEAVGAVGDGIGVGGVGTMGICSRKTSRPSWCEGAKPEPLSPSKDVGLGEVGEAVGSADGDRVDLVGVVEAVVVVVFEPVGGGGLEEVEEALLGVLFVVLFAQFVAGLGAAAVAGVVVVDVVAGADEEVGVDVFDGFERGVAEGLVGAGVGRQAAAAEVVEERVVHAGYDREGVFAGFGAGDGAESGGARGAGGFAVFAVVQTVVVAGGG